MLHTEKCSIAKIIKENIICNQFKHLEKDHSTYLKILGRQYLFLLIMRFLYIVERKLCHLMLKLEFIGVF